MGDIIINNATQNNLKGVSVKIPKGQLVTFTGVSGSGKSTLVFDVLYAWAQRELLRSVTAYARTSMAKISEPQVESIFGLNTCIAIDQRPLGHNPRSTIGTATDLLSFVRLLFARAGTPSLDASHFSFNTPQGACKTCGGLGVEMGPNLDYLIDFDKSLNEGALQHRTWKVGSRYHNIIESTGYFDMDKKLRDFTKVELDRLLYSKPEVVKSQSTVQKWSFQGVVNRLIERQGDSRGLKINEYDRGFFSEQTCESCHGTRLNELARSVRIDEHSIIDVLAMELTDLYSFILNIRGTVADAIVPGIRERIKPYLDVGLGYLTLSRGINSISNGESQRLKIAMELGSSLVGLVYILDEPTSGLHARDTKNIIDILKALRDKGNTVLVITHNLEIMEQSNLIIDIGPGAGINGGRVIAQGTPEELMTCDTETGRHLSGTSVIKRERIADPPDRFISMGHVSINNLKDVSTRIPIGRMTVISGVSGSGKSSFLEAFIKRHPESIVVDQNPIGISSRSNPATYTESFDHIRREFANATGISSSLLTFNGQGACEECGGLGYKQINMHFLGDVKEECSKCEGRRYRPDVLEYRYKDKTIADVLDMDVDEAVKFFSSPTIKKSLQMLVDVGLGYLRLGQPFNTLSGGEMQRVKLTKYLKKTGEIYVLDEPTLGLHHSDVDRLLRILDSLVRLGNTVVVVEHNLAMIKNADWVIDLGPGSGKLGGTIVAEGPPETIMSNGNSYTGQAMKTTSEFIDCSQVAPPPSKIPPQSGRF